jgi:hypothetical protein
MGQWFKIEGSKDLIWGKTIFTRHPLRYSIGRALHFALGSVIVTGWTEKYVCILQVISLKTNMFQVS